MTVDRDAAFAKVAVSLGGTMSYEQMYLHVANERMHGEIEYQPRSGMRSGCMASHGPLTRILG